MQRSSIARIVLSGGFLVLALAGPGSAQAATLDQGKGVTVRVGKTPLGNVLVGPNGRTLYMFTKDTKPGESACYNECAVNWPPLITEGAPIAGPGVNVALLGVITRTDGKLQVTYNGMPLYYWSQDKRPGDVRGQHVNGVWFVVNPDGTSNTQKIARVQVGKTALGNVLVGPNGLTLYAFANDKKNESTCYDACAANWPPLLTDVTPLAETGVNARLLGVTKRTDGTTQVTYNGMPLYYWVNDKTPGDLLGQGVRGVWFVVAPNGRTITRPAPVGAKVMIGKTVLGEILVAENGKTLYVFMRDANGESACYDACAANWPPLLTEARPQAGEGVDPTKLGTTRRKDGKLQVIYNGMPLYFWVGDGAPGDTNGQNVNGVWFVMNAAGEVVR
ncbi:MAG: hypothetical protein KatS3mg053_3374 [Candidatus Roseilinea sp.]|nr:MAG: hypothetical protein KatS3mg053_3374 [Candidatus Roseilinea sp.]